DHQFTVDFYVHYFVIFLSFTLLLYHFFLFFFFNHPPPTEINPLSLHDALPILSEGVNLQEHFQAVIHYDLAWNPTRHEQREGRVDRKSTRLNSSHLVISYAVFCLKKKKKKT